jgi:opacity protein-like surface antigen
MARAIQTMTRIIQALCLTTLLLLPSAASAGGFELTPFMGYQFGGDVTTFYEGSYHDVSISSSENFGLMVNIDLGDMVQLEFLYNTQDTRAKANRFEDTLGLTIDYWQVSMLWGFNPYEQFNPYFVVGLGATSLRPDGFSSETKFSGNIGGGVKIRFSDAIGLRFEGRLYGTYINSGTAYCDPFWCYGYTNSLYQFDVSAGLIIRFGD